MLLCALFTIGCQQGKKKDSTETYVYTEGVQKCEEISQQLIPLGIEVNGISPVADKNQAVLSEELKKSQTLNKIQLLLEEYINTANKILEAGDTKVVLFPEKEKIQNNLHRASKFLGQIYATRQWDLSTSAVVTREVDYAEFDARFKRIGLYINKMTQFGVDIAEPDLSLARVAKLKNAELVYTRDESEVVLRDFLRNKVLLERNQFFGLSGLKPFADQAEPIGGFFWKVGHTALVELEARLKNTPTK